MNDITFGLRMFAPGIGDLVMTLPPLFHILRRGACNHIRLFVFNEGQRDVAKAWGIHDVHIVDFNTDCRKLMLEREFYLDMSEHPLEKIWWGSQEYIEKHGRTHVKYMIEKILGGQGFPAENPQPPILRHKFYSKDPKTILLAPGGSRYTKHLPTDTWVDLVAKLKDHGYKPYFIGNPNHPGSHQLRELHEKGLDFIEYRGMGAMVYDISSAGAVISIDNGLYHIASIMEVPTLGIFGPMPSWLWGGVGTKTHNIDLGCGINCTATPGIWECVGHPCMRGITATQIMKKFEKEVELEPWINH